MKDTVNFTSSAIDVIGKFNSQHLCDADFVKAGVVGQLQYLLDDLKFWKANKKHKDQKPAHNVCLIANDKLVLYPGNNTWLSDVLRWDRPLFNLIPLLY